MLVTMHGVRNNKYIQLNPILVAACSKIDLLILFKTSFLV